MAFAQQDTMTGAQALVFALENLGVKVVFGLPGVHNLPIWKVLGASPIRLIGVRHEQSAAYAADGYARATGRLGVVLVTTGPGAANALGATGEARASGSPVLIVATDIPISLRRPGVYRGVLHETRDQGAMFAPVTKQTRTVTSAVTIAAAVQDSAAVACASPSGPVYLGIPTDLLSREVAASRPPDFSGCCVRLTAVDEAMIGQASRLLTDADRPLIWAGGGALRANAGAAVAELAARLDAPVLMTYMGKGLLSSGHPYSVPGPVQAPEVGALWDEADVVLGIGTDFDGMMTQNWTMPAPRALVSVNIDAADANKNYQSDVTLVGDALEISEALCAALPPAGPDAVTPGRMRAIAAEVKDSIAADDPEAARFLDAMSDIVPDDAIVVADMCIPGYWLGGYGRVLQPRKFAYPVGWGTLGFGFPASLGAAVADTGPAVCVTGDGGFLFACGELATVAQEGMRLTIVLVDDGGYGMLRFDQQHAGDQTFGVDLHTPNFEDLADSFGIHAQTVQGFGAAFELALKEAVTATVPRLIVVKARLKPPVTTSPRWYRPAA